MKIYIGWYGEPGAPPSRNNGRVHIVATETPDPGPICGSQFSPEMEFQYCSSIRPDRLMAARQQDMITCQRCLEYITEVTVLQLQL